MSGFRSVLFVCTGNICRSPIAMATARVMFPHLLFDSAGTLPSPTPAPADPSAVEVVARNGGSLASHLSKGLSPVLLASHELVLVMEPEHRTAICMRYPHYRGKTYLLGHWLDKAPIADPYRLPIEHFERCAASIERALQSWTPSFQPAQPPKDQNGPRS